MAKLRSRSNGIQDPIGESFTVQLQVPLLGVLSDTREAFHELCIRTGQQVLMAMMEADRESLCVRRAVIKSGAGCGVEGARRAG